MLLRGVLACVEAIHASTGRIKAGLQGRQERQAKPCLRMQTMQLGWQASSESEPSISETTASKLATPFATFRIVTSERFLIDLEHPLCVSIDRRRSKMDSGLGGGCQTATSVVFGDKNVRAARGFFSKVLTAPKATQLQTQFSSRNNKTHLEIDTLFQTICASFVDAFYR